MKKYGSGQVSLKSEKYDEPKNDRFYDGRIPLEANYGNFPSSAMKLSRDDFCARWTFFSGLNQASGKRKE